MWDLRVCVACLATNVRMFSMSATSQLQPYQLLSGIQFQSGDGMPQNLCWECAALVHKFSLFRRKCERAYLLLQDIYNQYDEISEEEVERIDRKGHNLSSNLLSESLNMLGPSTTHSKPIKKNNKTSSDLQVYSDVKVEAPFEFERVKLEDVKVEFDTKQEEKCNVRPEDKRSTEDRLRNVNRANKEPCKLESVMDALDSEDTGLECKDVEAAKDPGCTMEDASQESHRPGYKQRSRLYTCKKCSYKTHNQIDARKHQRTHKTDVKKKIRRIDVIDATITSLTQTEMEEQVRERELTEKYLNAAYKCTICYLTYRRKAEWVSHLSRHDESYGGFECDICKYRFTTKSRLRRHIVEGHSKKFECNLCPYICFDLKQADRHHQSHNVTCEICALTFLSNRSLRQHRLSHSDFVCVECGRRCCNSKGLKTHMERCHSNEKCKYSCSVCAAPLRTKHALQVHYRTLHPQAIAEQPKTFMCETCGRAYKTESLLRTHDLTHRGIKMYKCKHCERRFVKHSACADHMRTHSDVRAFVCDVCGKGFKTSTVLRVHRTRHSSTRDYKCDRCPKEYANHKNLWMHKKMYHSADMPYTCDYCYRGFSMKSQLAAHFKKKTVHKMSRPPTYRCAACDVDFATHNDSMTHRQQVHGDLDATRFEDDNSQLPAVPRDDHAITRVYKCKVCMKSFSKYSYLYKHTKIHTNERPFICSVCSKGFKIKLSLKQHLLTHSGEKSHVCEWCGKTFAYERSLKKHELTVHCPAPVPSSSHHM